MKKREHPSLWEEDETGSSGKGGSSMEHILDDDIIDLEDIVELPEEGEESEEQLDIDVEILDLDSDMDFDDLKEPNGPGKKGKAGKEEKGGRARAGMDLMDSDPGSDTDLLDKESDDVLLDFSFTDEDEEQPSKGHAGLPGKGAADPLMDFSFPGDDEERSGKDALDLLSEEFDGKQMDFALSDKERDGNDLKREDDLLMSELDEELMDFSFDEDKPRKAPSKAPAKEAESGLEAGDIDRLLERGHEMVRKGEGKTAGSPKIPAGKGDAVPIAAFSETSDAGLERFVSQIENRLVESLREIVEARLPEVVRSVLREEIDRLKKEIN